MNSLGEIKNDGHGNLRGARFAFAGMNYMVDPADMTVESGQCVDICNCDIDSFNNISRRDGYQLVASGTITSAWANSNNIYCVQSSRLYTQINGTLIPISNSPIVLAQVEFKQVNNIVVFSDGLVIGCLDGVTCYTFTQNALPDVSALDTYVKNKYPSGFTADATNFDTNVFNVSTLPGNCLEYYNGRLYVARGGWVYCTKAYDLENQDIRANVVAGFPDDVTVIARVTDGLYISTAKATYFLKGSGVYEKDVEGSGFEQNQVNIAGAIYGTAARFQNELIVDTKSKDTTVLWASTMGVVSASDSGQVAYLSLNQITMPVGSTGTAIVKTKDGIYQYVCCFNVGPDVWINASSAATINQSLTTDTWVVNTVTGAHSRYDNYAFNSFFKFGDSYFGSNIRGIYELTGDVDFGNDGSQQTYINAFALTPVTDFSDQHEKQTSDALLNARIDGDMNLTITVDEATVYADCTFPFADQTGKSRTRAVVPQGLRGMSWQFKISNTNGCYFKLFDFETNTRALKRMI